MHGTASPNYSERKKNLEIHRSIFYYKNYLQGRMEAPDPVKAFKVPIFDCDLKVYKGNVIHKVNGYWTVCQPSKTKQTFVHITGCELKTYISNADFLGKLLEEPAYLIDEIPDGLNTPDGIWTDVEGYRTIGEKNLRISSTYVNPEQGEPIKFVQFLRQAFNNKDENLQLFRAILKMAVMGNGFQSSVFITGNKSTINILLGVMKNVFGSYMYEYTNIKELYKGITEDSIPNCRMLVIKTRKSLPDDKTIADLQKNTFFQESVLNMDKYTTLYIVEDKQYQVDNAFIFRFSAAKSDERLISEAGKILNWILDTEVDIKTFDQASATIPKTNATAVNAWLSDCCIITSEKKAFTSAEQLFSAFKDYSRSHGFADISKKAFCSELSTRPILKIRRGSGIYYGIILL